MAASKENLGKKTTKRKMQKRLILKVQTVSSMALEKL